MVNIERGFELVIGKNSLGDKIFDVVNYSLLTVVFLIVTYPLYFILIASISDPNQVNIGNVLLLPKGIMFEGYERIFRHVMIWKGYRNSIFYTVAGTSINLVFTLTGAYALSRKDLAGKKIIMAFLVFTMLFQGGMIPRYLIIKKLMYNTVWAMLLPNAVVVWNLIIARTYFQTTIPDELLDSAKIDGCSNTKFFTRIVLPLSPAIIAVMTLFYAVMHWNMFFDALLFLKNDDLHPLQLVLRNILIQNQAQADAMTGSDATSVAEQQRIIEVIKYGLIVVASAPVLILYPFLQKYFVKGVMIGAIKG